MINPDHRPFRCFETLKLPYCFSRHELCEQNELEPNSRRNPSVRMIASFENLRYEQWMILDRQIGDHPIPKSSDLVRRMGAENWNDAVEENSSFVVQESV